MSVPVNLTSRAKRDIQSILRYVETRSKPGADAWYRRLAEIVESIGDSPESFGLAPEDEAHEERIRQAIFKTRKGLPYRALFVQRPEAVYIIHVRGSGQDQLDVDELRLP
ncbi:MAG: type II toxin-antitoxin system RelE/ParE family toxin [Planctomycetaceae bacterium]